MAGEKGVASSLGSQPHPRVLNQPPTKVIKTEHHMWEAEPPETGKTTEELRGAVPASSGWSSPLHVGFPTQGQGWRWRAITKQRGLQPCWVGVMPACPACPPAPGSLPPWSIDFDEVIGWLLGLTLLKGGPVFPSPPGLHAVLIRVTISNSEGQRAFVHRSPRTEPKLRPRNV